MLGMAAGVQRRSGLVLATWTVCLAIFCGSASAQCGQTVTRAARGRPASGQLPPLALGDSVLYDAAGQLARMGFQVNAMICRTMTQAIVLLRARAPALPHLVVLALGTNGEMTQRDVDAVLRIVGPTRVLAMVTPRHGDIASVPGVIRAAVPAHRGRMILLDWDRLSAAHPDWFAPDGIHLGGPIGIAAYAHFIASAFAFAGQPCPPAQHPAARHTRRARSAHRRS